MIKLDDVVKEKSPQIPDHPYRIFIIGGSGSGKTNSLFNLINHQSDIDKIYLYVKDPYEKRENVKMSEQNISMIQKILLNIQTIWLIFIKILEIINQIKNI